ncbi:MULTISPECIES: arabinonate dehydratase [Acidianus]|uniref:Mandelate racemase n=1 Tax=Candidatus Acidianus copahuensis TaxID=1160895 RepID=A0A031LU73_9CREN|nr:MULTISPECIES: arabinonate dehydratase [Acidianus]EZQ11376.1 mandelate racemase [Candidatus Acidianus copahuensis]NON61464.1 mandelate racemase/muconate lactonizing enzyme family protein [Acidianus sp. RZ1]
MIKEIKTYKLCYEGINEERDALAIKGLAEHPMEIVVSKIETSDGHIGYGESLAYGCSDAVQVTIEKILKPLLLKEDEELIEHLWDKMYKATLRFGRRGIVIAGISGVDIALWDIMGKKTKKPIYKLLGGSKRKIKAYITGGYYSEKKDIEKLREEEAYYVKMGFNGVKVKIGAKSMEEDMERLRSVREAVGENVKIAVDANNVYTFYEALEMGRKLENLGIWFFEEPIQTDYLDLSARLTEELEIPIAGYETAYTRWEFYEIMRKRAVDIVQTDAMWTGGISEMIKIGNMAKVMGFPLIPHYSAGGISLVANLHVAAALGTEWIEMHLRKNDLRDKIFEESIEIDSGRLVVPDRPGLGLTLREEIFDEYRCNS